jgi:hypothetical protein
MADEVLQDLTIEKDDICLRFFKYYFFYELYIAYINMKDV